MSPLGQGVAIFDLPLIAVDPLREILAIEEDVRVARGVARLLAGGDDLRLREDDPALVFALQRECKADAERGGGEGEEGDGAESHGEDPEG